jgi:hypothetical protein
MMSSALPLDAAFVVDAMCVESKERGLRLFQRQRYIYFFLTHVKLVTLAGASKKKMHVAATNRPEIVDGC